MIQNHDLVRGKWRFSTFTREFPGGDGITRVGWFDDR
jgi:hypothetical protein